MAQFEPFAFHSLEELRRKAALLQVDIPFSVDCGALSRPVTIGRRTAPNRIAVLPMEGSDCTESGTPNSLTARRYQRFAAGGAGLIWWEACAVVPEGRSGPAQMMITDENTADYANILHQANTAASETFGPHHRPVHILQLTHSGRYGDCPITAQVDPILDIRLSKDSVLASDEYLARLPEQFAASAVRAQQAGFDGVDIKACHGYLLGELLGARLRAGPYGGSFENRTRLLLDCIAAVRKAAGADFIIACRMNLYDAHPYPYSFGTDQDSNPDLKEPLRLVRHLCEHGVQLLTASAGNPHDLRPYLTRPFDTAPKGSPAPGEHPLESVGRLCRLAREMQAAAGSVPVVAAGLSWLRQYAPYAAAGMVQNGWSAMAGFARGALANPNLPGRILSGEPLETNSVCISCSRCIQLLRGRTAAGCAVRDTEIYAPLLRKLQSEVTG